MVVDGVVVGTGVVVVVVVVVVLAVVVGRVAAVVIVEDTIVDAASVIFSNKRRRRLMVVAATAVVIVAFPVKFVKLSTSSSSSGSRSVELANRENAVESDIVNGFRLPSQQHSQTFVLIGAISSQEECAT